VDVVRSGTVTPTANCAIGMTYLPVPETKPGTRFTIDVRGKRAPAEVVAMPFVPRRTKK
jgi:aminomethyltransferase